MRAPTLGTIFGTDLTDLPTNWSHGHDQFSPATATDWVYVATGLTYKSYNFFYTSAYESTGVARGWRTVNRPDWKPSNNLVLYPDESFS